MHKNICYYIQTGNLENMIIFIQKNRILQPFYKTYHYIFCSVCYFKHTLYLESIKPFVLIVTDQL